MVTEPVERRECPACHHRVTVAKDGARLLHHYAQGPGLGFACPQTPPEGAKPK